MPASDGGDDFVWIGGPFEGLGHSVVLAQEAIESGLKVCDRAEDPALQAPLREFGEETLDGVEPGARSRREVKGEAFVAREPLSHLRMLVGGVIVEDHVHDLARGDFGLDGVEEADELLMPMALHVASDHFAIEHVERGEEGRRSVALIIVGHRARAALFEG